VLRCWVAACVVLGVPTLSAQHPTTELIREARARIEDHNPDSAAVLLGAALAAATDRADSVAVLIALGTWHSRERTNPLPARHFIKRWCWIRTRPLPVWYRYPRDSSPCSRSNASR